MYEIVDSNMQKALASASSEYTKWLPFWEKSADTTDGEEQIKSKKEKYLPKTSLMKMLKNGNDLYYDYLKRAYFFNGTGRTVDGLIGLVYRNPIKIQVNDIFKNWINDMTMKNENIQSLSKKCLKEVIEKNRVGILIDYPVKDTVLSFSESEDKNYRPFATIYKAENILDWDEEIINNVYKTSYIMLSEVERKRTDLIIISSEKRRVLDLAPDQEQLNNVINSNPDIDINDIVKELPKYYRQRVFEKIEKKTADGKSKSNEKKKWALISEFYPTDTRGNRFNFIPFIVMTDKGLTWDLDFSMINDLASVNLSHYRNAADLENINHVACNPTPCGIGLKSNRLNNPNIEEIPESKEEMVSLGLNTFLEFDEGGQWGMLEASGSGSAMLENSMKEKKQEMALLGARILAADPKGIESAETAEIHRAGEQGVLSSAVDAINDGMKLSLIYMYLWETGDILDSNSIIFELNKDFLAHQLEPAIIQTALQAVQNGEMSSNELFMLFQKGEWIDSQKTWEDHLKEIEETKKRKPDNENPFAGEII